MAFCYTITMMRIDPWKGECLWLFCTWVHSCMVSEDIVLCVICLNVYFTLLSHYFECLLSFENFLAAVTCLEIKIAEYGFLINKNSRNVVFFGCQCSYQLYNDPQCSWFELIYGYVLSWLFRFVCIILLDPFVALCSNSFLVVH